MMKKICLTIISIILLCGCSSKQEEVTDKYYQQYQDYQEKLDNAKDFETTITDFSIRLIINPIEENEYRYDVIIDSANINMYYLQAIAKVEDDKNKSLPTIGVLEENNYSLVPGIVDKQNGIYKGVNLSGITDKPQFKVYVYLTYYANENDEKKIERYIVLYGNAS